MTPSLTRDPQSWRPLLAVATYGLLVLGLGVVALNAVSDILARRAEVAQAQEVLDQLEGRKPLGKAAQAGPGGMAGSPFLEGATVTVAGAALMQRVTAAVEQADGHITSSRVELEAGPLGPDFVAVTATLELDQPDLQNLLYDLEAGQPFLFVGQLVVQGRSASSEASEGPMQVTLTVYGRWQGPR